MSIKIVTDSTSYIDETIREKYDISVISLNVAFKTIVLKKLMWTTILFTKG